MKSGTAIAATSRSGSATTPSTAEGYEAVGWPSHPTLGDLCEIVRNSVEGVRSVETESLYDTIGENRLRHPLASFYDIIETKPDAHASCLLHIRWNGVPHSRKEQLGSLSGFLGGWQLYVRRSRHANLRRMHEHVEIGPSHRALRLACMARVVDGGGQEPATAHKPMENLTRIVGRIGMDVERGRSRLGAYVVA